MEGTRLDCRINKRLSCDDVTEFSAWIHVENYNLNSYKWGQNLKQNVN